jgi:hypothetical protein
MLHCSCGMVALGDTMSGLADALAFAVRGSWRQAGTSVRPHQERAETARPQRGHRRADRCPYGQQGARPLRRGQAAQPHLDPGHVLRPTRWPALPFRVEGPHQRAAVRRCPAQGNQGSLEDEQGGAVQRGRPLVRGAAGNRGASHSAPTAGSLGRDPCRPVLTAMTEAMCRFVGWVTGTGPPCAFSHCLPGASLLG